MKFLNNIDIQKIVKLNFVTNLGQTRSFYWDDNKQTASLEMGNSVVQQIGEEIYYSLVKNNTGVSIPNGTPVMITGIDGDYYTIAPATANSGLDYAGLTTQTIAAGQTGRVSFFGEVNELNTSGLTAGDILWLDPTTPGTWTINKPLSPNKAIVLGIVKKVGTTDGIIAVRYIYIPTADEITYDNTTSGLTSSNVKAALDELQSSKASISLLSSTLTLYATTAASDVVGYNRLVSSVEDADYDTVAVNISTGIISTNHQSCGVLIADPGLFVGNPGIINIPTIGNIAKTAGNSQQFAAFHFEIYLRNTSGTESLVATSSSTGAVNPSDTDYHEFSANAVLNNGTWLDTDRFVIKYYAELLGNTGSSYNFQFGGSSPVRTNVPVPVSVLAIHDAVGIIVETSAFNGILSSADTNIQAALNTIDDHGHTAAKITDFDTEVSNNTDVAANTAARHTHTNKTILDNTTASFITADKTKLDGIESGATADQVASEVPITDSGSYFAATNVETALQEVGAKTVALESFAIAMAIGLS